MKLTGSEKGAHGYYGIIGKMEIMSKKKLIKDRYTRIKAFIEFDGFTNSATFSKYKDGLNPLSRGLIDYYNKEDKRWITEVKLIFGDIRKPYPHPQKQAFFKPLNKVILEIDNYKKATEKIVFKNRSKESILLVVCARNK